jgi:peroxiredoxin
MVNKENPMSRLLCCLLICLLPLLSHGLEVGETAPEFELSSLPNQTPMELQDFAGKVRYVDFWASWCAPCRVSFPELIKLRAEMGSENFEIIAISVDEKTEDATRFLRRFDPQYPVLHDPDGKVAERYDIPAMPTSFIIDRYGQITMVHTGFRDGDIEKIRTHINSLLAEES